MSLSLFTLRHSPRMALLISVLAASALATQAQVVFSPPKNVSNSSGSTQSQQIAVDANGNVNLVWVDTAPGNATIFFSRSSDAGNTFSTPRSISKHAQSTASSPLVAVDSAGNVSVVWTETSPDSSAHFIYFSHSSDGVTFTNPQNISGDAGAATTPQMAVEGNGNVDVVWMDTSLGNSEVFFSLSADGGTTFSTPLNISNDAGDSAGPQIGVDPSGDINIAWEDDTPGVRYDVFFSRSSDGGVSFSNPLAITHSSEHSFAGFPLQIASGSNGNVYLLWISNAPSFSSSSNVTLSRSTNGGATFSVTGGLDFSSFGKMAIDLTGGDIGVGAYQDIDTGFPFVEFSLSSDTGFSSFVSGPEVSSTPNIAVDAIGRFDMTYDAGGFFNETPCFCFVQTPGGNTATITNVPVGPTAMAVDAGGNVYVAWLQSAMPGGSANVFFSRGAVPPFSFSVSPTSVIGGIGSSTGTVRLVSPAPAGGATISLSSSNPSAVSVPTSVTVPEGANSTTFSIGSGPVSSNTNATITASYKGANTATLTVEPLFVFDFFGNLTGGQTVTADIFLNEPAPSGLVIALSSSDPSVASVPASVTVPAGSRFASFNIPTSPVSMPTTIQITGTTNGVSQTGSFTVQPAQLQRLSVSPTTAINTSGSTGTVTLTGPVAPGGGAVISLSSSDPSATVPASVTIPAGATSASLSIATNPGSSTTAINVTISASYNGRTLSTSLTVLPLTVQQITQGGQTSVGGGGTVYVNVDMSAQAPAGGIVVPLSSSNPSIASVPASVTIQQGSFDSSAIAINTSPVSADTTVTISATFGGVTRTATLTVQPIMLTSILAFDVQGGASGSFFVGLNGPATSPTVVSMSSSNPSVLSVPGTVTIPQGTSGQGFNLTTSPVTVSTSVTIMASYNGVTVSRTITVHP